LTSKPWFYLIFKDWENAGVEGYDPAILQAIPDFKIGAPASDIKGYLSSYKSELIKVWFPFSPHLPLLTYSSSAELPAK
jgi:hypothetical protein